MSKAILNFANMNTDALTMASNCQLAVNALAADERALKAVNDLHKGESKETRNFYNSDERAAVKASKERANTMCTAFITRYVSVEDLTAGNIYHFELESFLRNIGALTGDEVDKKTLRKVESVRNLVVDRYRETVTRRKKGDDFLTLGESKEVKNTPVELFLALVSAMIQSGAIEYCGGGLARVDFEHLERAESVQGE